MKRINTSFYILILSALTVSSIIIALLSKASPLFTSKALFLCQKFISNTMFKVPPSVPHALVLAIGVILGIGLLSFLLQLVRTRIFLRKLLIKRIDPFPDLVKISKSLSLKDKVILVEDENLFSFCCGVKSCFIVVSTGLIRSLSDKELEKRVKDYQLGKKREIEKANETVKKSE